MSTLKGTIETETIIGSAASKMQQSLKAYEQAQQQLAKLPELVEEYTLKITQAESKLNDLKVAYNERTRQFNVELDLHKRQSIEAVVDEYLQNEDKVAVKRTEYEKLVADLTAAVNNQESVVKAEVAKANAIADNRNKSQMEIREAQYSQKEAENKAQINSMTAQLAALRSENESWKRQLDDERKASVERAKASAIGSVNLTPSGK
jgi:hypothetical protein